MTVVSGLARGIDTAAHKAALDSGGRTIAVLGTGITRCYPPENRDLAEQIAHAGAAVSHFRPSWPPGKDTFPRRNVVTSGLSHGTVVMPYLLATEAFYGELSRNGMSQYLVGLRELPKAVGCVWHYDFVSSDQNAVQGDFGEAWLEVVAAGCGLLHGRPATLDLQKADVQLTLRGWIGRTYNPTVMVQVKTEVGLGVDRDGNLVYNLDAPTYDVLRRDDHCPP